MSYLVMFILHPYHSPQQASLLQCSLSPASYAHSHLQLSVSDLTSYAGTLCPFSSPTHPLTDAFSRVSRLSLSHWTDMRQCMSWQVQSQMHNILLVPKHTSGQLCLAGWECPEEVRAQLSLCPPQLGITGSLPAAKSCRASRKMLLPNC